MKKWRRKREEEGKRKGSNRKEWNRKKWRRERREKEGKSLGKRGKIERRGKKK